MSSTPNDWMSNVNKKKETVAQRNATKWRDQGYTQWKVGDAQREKDLPIGGKAKIVPDNLKPKSLMPDKLKRRD